MIGIYPFGKYSILKLDLLHAYAPDYLELCRILKSGGALTYSWRSLLGTNILGSAITVASNPLNLLTLAIPEEYQAELLTVLVLFKIPFAAVTFRVWLKERVGLRKWISVPLSCAYALCSFNTAYHFNIMWIDSAILLPLVFLGINRILDFDDATLYCASLVLTILTSYGTAIQICAFAVLHLICGMILRSEYSAKKCKSFLLYSLLSGGICAVYLAALADSLSNSQYFREALPASALQVPPLRLLAAHFWGTEAAVKFYSDSAPNIYSGVFSVFLLPLFFLSKKIDRREKTVFSIYLLFLLVSFSWNIATFILHGLHFPTMFPHRYSYIYSFLLITAAARVCSCEPQPSRRMVWLLVLSFLTALAAVFLLYPQYDAQSAALLGKLFGSAEHNIRPPVPGRLSVLALAVNAALICIYAGLIRCLFSNRAYVRGIGEAALTAVMMTEALLGAYLNIRENNTMEAAGYNREQWEDMRTITRELNAEEDFYRTESARYRSQSGGRVYGYNGISGFSVSSGEYPAGLEELLYRLGMSSSFNNLMWNTPSPVLSSLFAQKYLIVDYKSAGETVQLFDYRRSCGKLRLYENPYVLPVGFVTPTEAVTWTPGEGDDPFAEQNGLFSALTAQGDVWAEFAPASFAEENLLFAGEKGEYLFEIPLSISSTDVLDGVLPRATVRYIPDRAGYMLLSLRCEGVSWAAVCVNGELVASQPIPWGYSSLDAGYVKPGDLVELLLDFNVFREGGERELIREGEVHIHAAQLNEEPFEAGIAKLKEAGLTVDSYDNTHLTGTVRSTRTGMLWTSIPWDHNWHVFIDGAPAMPVPAHGVLTAIPLDSGSHQIEFVYRMGTLPVGAALSIIFLMITICALALDAKKRRRQNKV